MFQRRSEPGFADEAPDKTWLTPAVMQHRPSPHSRLAFWSCARRTDFMPPLPTSSPTEYLSVAAIWAVTE